MGKGVVVAVLLLLMLCVCLSVCPCVRESQTSMSAAVDDTSMNE